MRSTTSMICLLVSLQGVAARSQAPEKSPAPADPARKGTSARDDSAKQEAFKAALKVIEVSMDKNDILAAMEKLRAGFPASAPVLIEGITRANSRGQSFAIQVLGENGSAPAHTKVLIPCLKSSSQKVRLAASMAIRRLGKAEGGLAAILEYLPAETDANNRKMAVKTLQEWRDPAALPVLAELLKSEKDKGVRNFLARALEVMTGENHGDDAEAWETCLERRALNEQAKSLIDSGKKVKP